MAQRLTRKKLERFIKVRNASPFSSNLQFQIDAHACGFSVDDLGKVVKLKDGTYSWATPFGCLLEENGRLTF